MPPLTQSQVLSLLEKAQILPPEEASKIISLLPQRTRPHRDLTRPLLDLLEIHPKESLPYITDLLPSTATKELLESLSSLLASDRKLLPPILGILPSLPLSPEQLLQTRATIAYALDIVDRDDIPTVVRTLSTIRNSWAADTLRSRIRLTTDIAPVVAEAVSEILAPKNHLAERLLSPVPPPRGIDILLLVQAFESRLSGLARQSLITLTKFGAFSRCYYPKTIACLATTLPTCPHGTVKFLTTLLSSARIEAGEIASIAKLCKAVIMAYPPASIAISSARGFVATIVHIFLISSLDNPGLLPNGLHRIPGIAVTALQHMDSSNWAPLFISVRKGALFGTLEDYQRVEGLSRCVVQQADEAIVTELFEILDRCTGECLAEPLAVVLLDLLGYAVMRGMFMEKMFRKRVDKLPDGLLSSMKAGGLDIVRVDVGKVWKQRSDTVANVVASSVSLLLADRGVQGIARGLLDVSVLVPVVCITLYEAVEDLSEPIPISPKGRRGSQRLETIPAQVSELESGELSKAVLSFAVGIATIVGLLNQSSRWLGICRNAIEKRHERSIGEADRKSMWMVLDRLTEFDRMLIALGLAMEALQRQWNDLRTPQKGAERDRRRKQEAVLEALERAQTVRESVLMSLDGEGNAKRTGQEAKVFPRLSLAATVLSLASIPDEEGVEAICDPMACKKTRDVEIVRLDKLLLYQLLRLMTLPRSAGAAGESAKDANVFSRSRSVKAGEWAANHFFDVDKRVSMSIGEIIPYFEKQLEEKDNIFCSPDDFPDDEAIEEDEDQMTVLWAPLISSKDLVDKSYIQSTVSQLLGTDEKAPSDRVSSNVAHVVNSPAFAALLLDRATIYVAVARKARMSGVGETILSDMVMASGLALRCLNGILRIVPMLSCITDSAQSAGETEKMSCEFLNELGKRLLVGVRPCDDAQKNPRIISKHLNGEGWKVISTLRWISNTSVETVVASAAIESVLIVSEFDVCHKNYARQTAFSSLTMVYEYEGGAIWENNELDLVLRDSYSEWSLRRRRSQERTEEHVDQLDAPDPHPWIEIKLKKHRRERLTRQRLSLYFSGMYVPDALNEACGWIRELSVALSVGVMVRNEETTTEASRRGSANEQRKSAKRKRAEEPKEIVREEVLTSDTLLEMVGFRCITEVLIDIVFQGLQLYPISTSLPVEDTNDEWSNPILHLCKSLRLFCGVVDLYRANRERVVSARRDGRSNISLDLEFDSSMTTGCVAVLQLMRSRIDELFAWYSNPSTDISQLSSETMKSLHEVIGSAAQAVNRCSQVAESVKAESERGIEGNVNNAGCRGTRKKARKTPGYEKRARKRLETEELSRARRMIPRLTGQSESVVKSLQKLAKIVGIPARQNLSGLASQPIASDTSLHFCIGIQQGVDEAEGCISGVDDSEAGRSKTTAEMSSDNGETDTGMEIEGFHVRSKQSDNHVPLEETVTVNFKTVRWRDH